MGIFQPLPTWVDKGWTSRVKKKHIKTAGLKSQPKIQLNGGTEKTWLDFPDKTSVTFNMMSK